MKAVIQRVTQASVRIDGQTVGSVDRGYLVLLGVAAEDTREMADKMVRKLVGLRIFEDECGKINRSITDVGGSLLIVSQFTLCADTSHGNRPGFSNAADPETANALYGYFSKKCREAGMRVENGVFGAHMDVELCNDGPFTIILEQN
ncbi:MAG: D-tyrosyl-tRNA(Tyr) deacylase [Clostridiaceae bacterium]|nr:D-tyrosyl-tRNA(Tyr) deacylase [Clostridiaceae bacterium]